MNRLKELRVNASQEKIASIIGITQRTYSNYENGSRQIPDEIKIKLANYFGVSVDYLLGREDILDIDKKPNKNEFQYIARGGKTGTLKFKSDEDMQKALKILQTLADEQFGPDKD